MIALLVGLIIGLIIGALLGAYICANFDVINTEYSIEKLKAKNGAHINIKQAIKDSKPKRKLFKRIFTKNKK